MHYTSWLASAVLFTTSVSAFYPYDVGSAFEANRASIATIAGGHPQSIEGQRSTVDIKKRRTRWHKRDNKYPVSLASEPVLPNSMAIHQDGQDYSYFSSIKLGSNGKEMWMLIDSGSANTWVFGSDCSAQACTKHDTFGKADSETLNITSTEWNVSYGTGDVGGLVASDKFTFAGYDVELGLGLALKASNDFINYPMDGILGLGRSSSNKLGTPTLMDVLADQKILKANLFGVHLSRSADGATDGQITFGAADDSRFSGDLSYTASVSSDGLWEIPAEDVVIDGQAVGLTGKTAIIDTGTSYILMPPDDAKALHAKLPGSSNNGEKFTIPCDTKLPIQFTFSGIKYDVSPKDFVGKPDKEGRTCASNIIGHQSFGPNTWLLGDVFLKNVYTVFDFDTDRIGFGIKSTAPTVTEIAPSSISSLSPLSSFQSVSSSPMSPSPNSPTTDYSSSTGQNLPSQAGSPMATFTGKATAKSSSAVAEATAVGSTGGGSGSPMEGIAISLPGLSLVAIFGICFTTLVALLEV